MRAPASAKAFENVRMTITPSSSSGSAVSPPEYSKYASSTASGRAAGISGRSPYGLPGRQRNVSTASAPSSAVVAPARFDATLYTGYVGSGGIATTSPGPAYARATSMIRSSAPAPRTTFSGSTPAYSAIASWMNG